MLGCHRAGQFSAPGLREWRVALAVVCTARGQTADQPTQLFLAFPASSIFIPIFASIAQLGERQTEVSTSHLKVAGSSPA